MQKLIIIISSLFIVGCGDATVKIIPWGEISNVQISNKETGYFIAFAPCTVSVKNRSDLIAKFIAKASNYCANHSECESCYQSHDTTHASQIYFVDGDGTFYVGRNK